MRRSVSRAGWSAMLAAAGMAAGCIPSIDSPPANPRPPASTAGREPIADPPPPRSDPATRHTRPSRRPPPPRARTPKPVAEQVVTLPAPPPTWETRAVAADAAEVAASRYRVRAGDTLGRIADRTGAGADAIARANGLTSPFTVRVGQDLAIPAGRYHLVRQGQSGIAIARAYGVPWTRIVAANVLTEPYVLRAGQRVVIPGEAAAPASRAAERAAAFTLDVDTILTGGEPALAVNQAPARPAATPARILPATAAVVAPARLTGGAFLWPVDGRVVKRFGPGASGERNDGIKIAIPLSTPVRAAADGVVAYAGDGVAALGGLVMVKHGDGWTSIYGHAAKLLVQRGQSVKRGQTIALSGDTGFADRPELHFELRRGRVPVDPQSRLPRGS